MYIDVFLSVLSKKLMHVAENYWFNWLIDIWTFRHTLRFDVGTMLRVFELNVKNPAFAKQKNSSNAKGFLWRTNNTGYYYHIPAGTTTLYQRWYNSHTSTLKYGCIWKLYWRCGFNVEMWLKLGWYIVEIWLKYGCGFNIEMWLKLGWNKVVVST